MVALCYKASKINLTIRRFDNLIMKKVSFLILALFSFSDSYSQNNDSLIHALLLDIASMQVQKDGEFYAGQFPSFRECGGAPHNYQPDNNIFYTAVAAFALRNMLPYLN